MLIKRSRGAAVGLLMLLLLLLPPSQVAADEGMYLPDTITRLPLAERGLKIPLTEIYNPGGVSIKDAIVIVDGGTGEFVSPEGLLLTNHHVAFDALSAASSPANNYGMKGYLARSRADELRAQGYTVTITQDLKDVTSDVLTGLTDTTPPAERRAAIQQKIHNMEAAGSAPAEGISVRVLPMNEGLSYYLFKYLVLRDVRIVYAPPKNIGFFGGDPDNFEWPRHCGDFTFMRAYVGPDGKPADYAANNVPFKPRKFLSLSMGGVRPGDFTMVMGYPGSTRRYRESYSVAYNQDEVLPFNIDLLTTEIQLLEDAGKNDPARRIKLQSTIFELNNALKDYQGSVLALRRADLVARKRADEAAFERWISENPERKAKYGDALPELGRAYQALLATGRRDLLVPQLFQAGDLLGIAFTASQIAIEKEKAGAQPNPSLTAAVQRERERIVAAFADRNPSIERGFLTFLLRRADELPPEQKIEAIEKRFAGLQGDARRRAEEDFARSLVDSKRFTTPQALAGLLDLTTAQLRDIHEPFVELANELGPLVEQIQENTQKFNATAARWRPVVLEGMSEMRGIKPYPDANRTLRFTFGEVKGYVPHDGAIYEPFTTLAGVIEKDTGREPFDVPEKLKQLYRAHDFGPYALPGGSNVPVDFLSTTDIIGGNSGSPIMNAVGEQVGIIFDGNYEGLGNDFFYDGAEDRSISVDIRYVLFIADKFGGAGYILKELELKNAPPSMGGR